MQIVNNHNPQLLLNTGKTIEKVKEKKNLLAGENISEKIIVLDYEKKINKLFLQDDLKLPELANIIAFTKHQLSQLLNDYIGKNFNTYVNSYRVHEVMDIMIFDRERSATNISYVVGFTNYMTFQKAFKSLIGISPAEFMKGLPPL